MQRLTHNFAPHLAIRLKRQFLVSYAIICAGLVSTAGCYQPNLAPSIEYSGAEVETLNDEIENMEWD